MCAVGADFSSRRSPFLLYLNVIALTLKKKKTLTKETFKLRFSRENIRETRFDDESRENKKVTNVKLALLLFFTLRNNKRPNADSEIV